MCACVRVSSLLFSLTFIWIFSLSLSLFWVPVMLNLNFALRRYVSAQNSTLQKSLVSLILFGKPRASQLFLPPWILLPSHANGSLWNSLQPLVFSGCVPKIPKANLWDFWLSELPEFIHSSPLPLVICQNLWPYCLYPPAHTLESVVLSHHLALL